MCYQSVINTLDQYHTRSRLVEVGCHMGWSTIQVKNIPLLFNAEFHRLCGHPVNLIFKAFKNILNGVCFFIWGVGGGREIYRSWLSMSRATARSRFATVSMAGANLVPSLAVCELWWCQEPQQSRNRFAAVSMPRANLIPRLAVRELWWYQELLHLRFSQLWLSQDYCILAMVSYEDVETTAFWRWSALETSRLLRTRDQWAVLTSRATPVEMSVSLSIVKSRFSRTVEKHRR